MRINWPLTLVVGAVAIYLVTLVIWPRDPSLWMPRLPGGSGLGMH